jgi:Asp-tRNA(Asn)/Glu-tRNA(Gln) amidotransferase B subunit
MPAVRSLSNKQARAWYLEHDARIPSMIDRNASIEEQARQAFELRNLYRTIARDLMHDQEARKYLDETQPNKTFEQMIEHKKSKGMTYEEALQDIVRTATKTNAKVNKELGLE